MSDIGHKIIIAYDGKVNIQDVSICNKIIETCENQDGE